MSNFTLFEETAIQNILTSCNTTNSNRILIRFHLFNYMQLIIVKIYLVLAQLTHLLQGKSDCGS